MALTNRQVILEQFLPFHALAGLQIKSKSLKINKMSEDIMILHQSTSNYDHMMFNYRVMAGDKQTVLFW